MIDMRSQTIVFLRSLYCGGSGFRFYAKGSATLLSTCFGVQLAYLVRALDEWDRHALAKRIQACQGTEGLFCEENFAVEDLTGRHTAEYFLHQCTFFSLIALDMIGERPHQPLVFLDRFRDAAYLESWIKQRDMDDFWYSSNEWMFLLYFLAYRICRMNGDIRMFTDIARVCLDALDRAQDSQTGLWGDRVRENPINGIYGAAHIYLFYDYFRRPIAHLDRAVWQVLQHQNTEGLWGGPWGGACEDYDAVEILHRAATAGLDIGGIAESLERVHGRIDHAAAEDKPGFSYYLPSRGRVGRMREQLAKWRKRDTYRYSGWVGMECGRWQPDVWGSYFRTLTLAVAEQHLDVPASADYQFYDLPGWGYFRKECPR